MYVDFDKLARLSGDDRHQVQKILDQARINEDSEAGTQYGRLQNRIIYLRKSKDDNPPADMRAFIGLVQEVFPNTQVFRHSVPFALRFFIEVSARQDTARTMVATAE